MVNDSVCWKFEIKPSFVLAFTPRVDVNLNLSFVIIWITATVKGKRKKPVL